MMKKLIGLWVDRKLLKSFNEDGKTMNQNDELGVEISFEEDKE